jgi:hypothetical protein
MAEARCATGKMIKLEAYVRIASVHRSQEHPIRASSTDVDQLILSVFPHRRAAKKSRP